MTGPVVSFNIRESRVGETLRLSVTGDLDMATAPALEARLTALRSSGSPVSIDLSKLEFIDSTGIHLLVRLVGDARIKRWPIQIEEDVAPQVMYVLKLMNLDRALLTTGGG